MEVTWSEFKSFIQDRSIGCHYVVFNNNYIIKAADDFFELSCMIPYGELANSDTIDFETNFKANANKKLSDSSGNKKTSTIVTETPPFASPSFRTKRNKTTSIETIAAGETKNIDFLLTSELYVHGGGVVYTGAEIGDYVTAEIRDINSVIPEAYRAALCENWPCVASYISGEWVPKGDGRYEINTYPLNAKITAGLYLRITYVACNTGSDRKVGVNYYLAKKL